MVLAIVQARINSDRFPFKIFARFSDGSCVLERVIKQVKYSETVDKIVVATNYISFNSISSFVSKLFDDVSVVSGPDNDVLERFVRTIQIFDDVDTVIRITADNPLTCPRALDLALRIHKDKKADLTHFLGIPLGTGVEVINPVALLKASNLAHENYDREHVTPYIYKNPDSFKVLEPKFALKSYQNYRVTLDTKEDFEFIDRLMSKLNYRIPILVEDVIETYQEVEIESLLKI